MKNIELGPNAAQIIIIAIVAIFFIILVALAMDTEKPIMYTYIDGRACVPLPASDGKGNAMFCEIEESWEVQK